MPQLISVTKKYGDEVVFDDFSLALKDGAATCVMGASGVGKTTLLNVIADLTEYTGKTISEKPVSYIFQAPRLLDKLTVCDNLEYVMKNTRIDKKTYLSQMDELLETAGIADKKYSLCGELSGGQKQRVSLVRAFLYPSQLLLMDEPFNSLDLALKLRLMTVYKKLLAALPRTVVMVTHDPDEAVMLCDETVVLGKNRVLARFSMPPCITLRDVNQKECVDTRAALYNVLFSQSSVKD